MEKVKAWRKKWKLSQSEIAYHLGVTQATYSRHETMKVPMPPRLMYRLIAFARTKGTTLRPQDFYSWVEGKQA